MKQLNNFVPNQKVYLYDRRKDKLLTGRITDEICSKRYKFKDVPLQNRSLIPVKWENNEVGLVFYKHLIVSLKQLIKK